jgi:hypothetical protein
MELDPPNFHQDLPHIDDNLDIDLLAAAFDDFTVNTQAEECGYDNLQQYYDSTGDSDEEERGGEDQPTAALLDEVEDLRALNDDEVASGVDDLTNLLDSIDMLEDAELLRHFRMYPYPFKFCSPVSTNHL